MLSRELTSFARQINYLCPERYVSGRITEYDIKQANINILLRSETIDRTEYDYLQSIPKQQREIIIGKKIKEDKSIDKVIKKGISDCKVALFDTNNIRSYEVIRIANDAVYINRVNPLNITKFDNVEFVPKSISNTYLKLRDLLFFINYENNNINVDIKGLGTNYDIHQPIISLIVNIVYDLELNGVKSAISQLQNIIDDYINKRLGIEYYREFNVRASYHVINTPFYLSTLDYLRDEIDINYNLFMLRELLSILYENYTSNYRKL